MRTAVIALVVLGTVLGTLLGLAPAAHAKGPTAARIEGPGLPEPVTVVSYDATDRLPGLGTLIQWTGAMIMFDAAERLTPDEPTADHGPRYLVTYYMDKQPVLLQELYPFTAKGPYSFTPAGQRSPFTSAPLPSGWWHAPPEVVATLAVLGVSGPLPAAGSQRPAAASAPAPALAPEPVRDWKLPPAGWWLAGVLVAVALVAGTILVRARFVGARR